MAFLVLISNIGYIHIYIVIYIKSFVKFIFKYIYHDYNNNLLYRNIKILRNKKLLFYFS